MGRILTLGETLAVAWTDVGDPLRTAGTLRLSTAGAESTVAIGVSRLGRAVTWVGTVGADELGARIRRELAAERVDVGAVRVVPDRRTGLMVRDRRSSQRTIVTYYREDSAGSCLDASDVDAAFAGRPDIDLLHVTGITPLLSDACAGAIDRAVSLARSRSVPISFDVNHRRNLARSHGAATWARRLLASTDLLFVGDDELHLLTAASDPAAAARRILRQGLQEVILKRGAAGATAYLADGTEQSVAAVPVTAAVDVIGAGDSFVAGYLAARADGRPLPERLRWAVTAAACTVETHGDWEGLPTPADLERRSGPAALVR